MLLFEISDDDHDQSTHTIDPRGEMFVCQAKIRTIDGLLMD
jgi:hypothetical protein